MGEATNKFGYGPNDIRICTRLYDIGSLLGKLKEGLLVYKLKCFVNTPGWSSMVKSRLIESILIRLPIHPFLIDATLTEQWVVEDGSSQLFTLDEFINKDSFSLTGLEYLDLEGLRFSELEPRYQRRLQETNVTVQLIDPGTPPAVKFNIINRIKLYG